ncbi:hypothetical protein H8L32_26700 [Undibacterium sp. CY18W]|uniref:Uncharacterized protein n=1 Tax=Undibacterium hunanense TaxID=2762292 RepID=A0ABR6ZYW8_9BURK|nr:hypothetical protein [Undibacterium hunanense]MBC3921081.1 hypothetical protein [Undibacterium hunanense]
MPDETLLNDDPSVLGDKSRQPELLVSAVLHLMSHYTVSSTQKDAEQTRTRLASVIERHLKVLANLPDLAPVLKATCQQLSEQWASLVERKSPQQSKMHRLSWLLAGARRDLN